MGEPGMSVLSTPNAAFRLLLELVAIGVLGVWGYSIGGDQLLKLGLGLGVPLVVIVVWGLLGAPAAPYRLDQPWRVVLEVIILGGAALALYSLERPVLAGLFAIVAAVNTVLLFVLGQS